MYHPIIQEALNSAQFRTPIIRIRHSIQDTHLLNSRHPFSIQDMYGRLPEVKSCQCSDEFFDKRRVGSFELCAKLSFAFADPCGVHDDEGDGSRTCIRRLMGRGMLGARSAP